MTLPQVWPVGEIGSSGTNDLVWLPRIGVKRPLRGIKPQLCFLSKFPSLALSASDELITVSISLPDPATVLTCTDLLFFFKMPPKTFFARILALIFLLASTSSVYVQAAVIPALGNKGTPAFGDIQRPSIADHGEDLDITQNLDTSTAVMADACGAFTPPIVNLNLYVHRPRPFVTSDRVS